MKTNFFAVIGTAILAATSLAACNHIDDPDSSGSSSQITIGSLLQEMVDRDAVARYPDPVYTSASFSSRDRASLSKDVNWFANGDNNWFLRMEKVNGREEYVLFDAEGPGAVTRWWMTFAGAKGGSGCLRVYIDDASEAAIAATPFELLSGTNLTVSPLAGSVSKLTPVEQRGHNLFYPIPYSSHCKITYCSAYIHTDNGGTHIVGDECVYYNIEYRTYPEGTSVESFSKENSAKYKEQENAAARALNSPTSVDALDRTGLDCALAPGESKELEFKGPSAIREITMKLEAADMNQALRSTVLEIEFDGESTVFIPVGEFFGAGYVPMYTRTWYVDVKAAGAMTSRWVMPFGKSARLKITNYGSQQVWLSSAQVGVSKWKFDGRSMYFHAIWKQYPRLDTRKDPVTGITCEHYDLNFVTLDGKGVYMGDSMTLYDISSGWWGEGDEKVYVDDESFPAIFGTGTEDYYGYAWCHPNTIVDHPFTSQPSGSGNLAPGYTFNSRLRSLDRIAFGNRLVFDMELWHWNQSTMSLGISNYFYMLPGGKVLNQRDASGVTEKPVTSSLDLVEMKEDLIDIEAEYMNKEQMTGGNFEIQSAFGENWSNGLQVFWNNVPAGSEMTLSFESPYEGTFNLKMLYAFSWDYGTFDLWFNDLQIENGRDFYAEQISTGWTEYGQVQLHKGKNTVKVKAVAPHKGIASCFFGLDRIILEKQ